jgi:hypothetical protein
LPISDSKKGKSYLAFLLRSTSARIEEFLHLLRASNSHVLFLLENGAASERKNRMAQLGATMLLLT